MYVDLKTTDKTWQEVYHLCIALVTPRPIALVSTISADGHLNLAPFSLFNMISANPPVIVFSPALRADRQPKDTLANIRATGEFVAAIVTEAIAEPMVRAAAALPAGHSEFDFAGLTPIPASRVRPALVRESPANFECRLRQIIELGDQPGAGSVVFGDVLAIHAADWLMEPDGRIDPRRLRTVGRLGGKWYCTVSDPYELEIPEV